MSSDQESVVSGKTVRIDNCVPNSNEIPRRKFEGDSSSLSGIESDGEHIGRTYIKKIRERFQKSNEMINREINRMAPEDNIKDSVLDDFHQTKGINESSLIIDDHDKKSMTSRHSISSRMYDELMSQDTESIAPSRKVKRKKVRKIKYVTSKHSIIEESENVVLPKLSKTQVVENKFPKKKVIHNKTIKHTRKLKPLSREYNASSRPISRSTLKPDSSPERGGKIDRSKSFTKLNHMEMTKIMNDTSNNSIETLYDNRNQLGNQGNGDFNMYDDKSDQFSKLTNNYQLPTIASKMKKVDRNSGTTKCTKSVRIPFVVGTSINTTNNLYLLKQQISSKLKAFCLSSLNEDQLSGWNVNNLRMLILSIEKLRGGYRLRNTYKSKHTIGQESDEIVNEGL